MSKNFQFCNNCGRNGHLFHSCKKPISSLGIICFTFHDNKLKFLLICRKDSLGYVDFLRGKYPIYNKLYIQNLLEEMTIKEKNNLLTRNFSDLWNELWGGFIGNQYLSEEKISKNKFKNMKEGVILQNNNCYNLEDLIHQTENEWVEPEWGFPKGRRNYLESDINCAIREFTEETGLTSKEFTIIKNIIPLEEIFMGSNFKSYKHKYYLAYIKNINDITLEYQKSEVSDIGWFDVSDCKKKIRPYNFERLAMFDKICKVINTYNLI
jgi:ADP-ribose pyrophosphatase YjhB (NUDIX family)